MKRVALFLGVLLSVTACSSVPDGMVRIRLESPRDSIAVDVELATTAEAQAQGLMGRTQLPQGQGMLFVFPDAAPRYFWMKNTLLPLDILYFSATGALVSVRSMEPCQADPCSVYPSDLPAQYALEVPQGFIAAHRPDALWRLVLPEHLEVR